MLAMASFFSSFISNSLDILRDNLLNHVCFIVQVEDYVDALSHKALILENKQNDVEEKIRMDERAARKATNEVEGWSRRAEAIQHKVQLIRKDFHNRDCMFLDTSWSFNCFSNYLIGRRAVEENLNMEAELKYIVDIKEFTTEVLPPPAQEMSTTSASQASGLEIQSKLKKALDFLRDDEEGALSLWGMGGVGKTTILQHINNSLAKDSSFGFHHVIYIVASKGCTVEKIQGLLVEKLGLYGGDYFTRIFNYLSNKSFVLLLDDVWEPLDLRQAGIPLPLGAVITKEKRKLIMTTRFLQVCHNMDVHRSIRVECLRLEAARLLFWEKVGEDAITSHPLIPKLANKVADECDGLPLALITIARAMAGNQAVEVWENTLRLLRTSKLSKIPGMDDPLPLLKVSYDYLKNPREKECFLHCALWPEDCKISKDELIQCWMGHGLLEKFDDIQEAYNQGHAIIDSLQKACLLEHVSADYNELRNSHVKLHDVIRDMALWIARDCGADEKKWVVLVGEDGEMLTDEKSWSNAHKMSLMFNDMITVPPNIQRNPNLVTLIIHTAYSLIGNDMRLVQNFHALKYLDLTNCKFLGNSFPIEICSLHMLEYLNLSDTYINSLPEELKNLLNLKYLIAQRTAISEVPRDLLSNLISLLVLDLYSNEKYINIILHSSIIDHLVWLEGPLKALGINVSTPSDLQKLIRLSRFPIRNLCIQEMEGLRSLRLLSPDVLGSKHMRSNLHALSISYCDRSLEEVVIEGHNCLTNLQYLTLNRNSCLKEIAWKGVEPSDVFLKLRAVDISDCHELKHVAWVANLPCLERLRLHSCHNMEQVVCEEAAEMEGNGTFAFPRLRILRLSCLVKLSSICDRALTFPSLEFIDELECPKLKMLPFRSLNACNNLRKIKGETKWWESLELESGMRTSLQPLVELDR